MIFIILSRQTKSVPDVLQGVLCNVPSVPRRCIVWCMSIVPAPAAVRCSSGISSGSKDGADPDEVLKC